MEEFFTASLFSMELVNYVVTDDSRPRGVHIDPCLKEVAQPLFKEEIGDAVRMFVECNENSVYQKYLELKKFNAQSYQVLEWAMSCSINFFKNGYDHHDFLNYCGFIVGLADCYFVRKKRDVTQHLCQAITSVFSAFMLTGEFKDQGGWDKLYECATQIILKYESAT